ncbi:hypothetical protein B4589_013515 [Halolamina sp. CBA1230]|nr:hypothetical protein [Halolamina sp. CBA1230]QKY21339.1 hypothetical protein B4589_013515 [Halolamina sp. CBA1230]
MAKDTLKSGFLSVVFATAGVAPPVIVALIAYISITLKNDSLNPPPATS